MLIGNLTSRIVRFDVDIPSVISCCDYKIALDISFFLRFLFPFQLF